MIYDQPEHFGTYEKVVTEKEKEEITRFLKFDKHVPVKFMDQVYHAEADAERFRRLGILGGVLLFTSFFFMPIIRGLPIKQRLFWPALPGGYAYKHGYDIYEEKRWNRGTHIFQNQFIRFIRNGK
ncbi:hypothetical protein pb186bvf_012579 [Paramecium bursaria]